MGVNSSLSSAKRYLASRRGIGDLKRGLQARFGWLPRQNAEKVFSNPWSERKSIFDYSKPMKDLAADMVIYCVILQMKRTKMFAMRCSEELQAIYTELVGRAYYKVMKGLPCWKPTYDPLGFVNSHVNFAWLEFYSEEKVRNDLFSRSVQVPEDWPLDYRRSLELAEELAFCDRTTDAAALFERLAREMPVPEDAS